VAVSAASTAEELRRRGHEVVIFAPRYRGYDDQGETVIRFPAVQWYRSKDFALALPILSSPLVLPALHQQEQFFIEQRFDVVHTHSPFTIGTIGARWGRRHHVPVVFTFHTLYHRYLHYVPLPRWYSRPYTVKRVRRHIRLCSHIIAPSRAIERFLRFFRPKAPISVVPTGVRVERFTHGDGAAVRERHAIAPDDLVLLYVGRIVHEKNLAFLVRSLAPLLGQRTCRQRVRLLMVGGGPALRPLQKLAAQQGVRDDVICTDFVSPADIADYFAASDVFTFASRTETQGVSISEALAAGLPCVVVGTLGAAEAVTLDVNGFVVPPREDAFRDAVLRLLQNADLRDNMAAQARALAPALALEQNVDKLVEIYQGLVAERAR